MHDMVSPNEENGQRYNLSDPNTNSRAETSQRSFENSFWGKDDRGVEALMTKMRKAKQTCAELKNMLSARAAVEEEYGKKLIKVAKADICKDEMGEMQKALSRLRSELETTGNVHVELSQKIKLELEASLSGFINNQRDRRKAQAAIIEKSSKSKSLKLANLLKVKEKYLTEKAKVDLLESSVSSNAKDSEKVQIRQYKMKELEQEYVRLSGELEETMRIWQHDWRVSCRLFQELEEERIAFIKKLGWDYSNLIATACLKDDESCERIRTALQTIHVEDEIQSFILERGTGYDPDYEMDGSPIYEIPTLDSPFESPGGNGFHLSNPATFIKRAFQRPHSFVSSSSRLGASSSSKRNSSVISSQASHEGFNPPSSNPMQEQDNASFRLEGESKVSLTSLHDAVEANSSSAWDPNLTTSPKNISRSSIDGPPQQAPTTRPLFFVRVLYDYLREMELEMSISAGQVVAVLATHDDGWWEGEYVDPTTGHSTRGIFPSNFTRRIG